MKTIILLVSALSFVPAVAIGAVNAPRKAPASLVAPAVRMGATRVAVVSDELPVVTVTREAPAPVAAAPVKCGAWHEMTQGSGMVRECL